MSTSPDQFAPAWWLPGPHSQTLGARWLRPGRGPAFRRERWTTPDGDFLDLDSADAIPETAMKANLALTPLISNHGGHVGFISGATPFVPHFWAEDRIVRWLRSVMFGV